MGVLSNKVDREQLKPGDHIYSWRRAFVYAHHGIYVGDGMVTHFTKGVGQEVGTGTIPERLAVSSVPLHDTNNPCPICGYQSKKEGVISSCLDCFLYGGNLYLFEYGVSPAFFLAKARGGTCTCVPSDPTEDVLHRASILLKHGFGGYDIYKKNCEVFAIYCKTGLLVGSGQAASCSAAADAVVSTIRKMTTPSHVSVLAMVVGAMYSYGVKLLDSDIGRLQESKIPVESLIASLGLNEPEKKAEVLVERPIASPNLNEQEKTTEVPVEMHIASPGLNEPEKTAEEVPVERHKASTSLNEPEKTAEGSVKMLIASPGLNKPEKTAEVPVKGLKASPGLNEPEKIDKVPASSGLNELEKTNKTAKENQHRLNRGCGNRGGRRGRREAERRKKEEANRVAKLAEIAEKQRQREREVEEKERQRREALLGRGTEPASRRSEPPTGPPESGSAAPAAAAGPAPGKYVPPFKREKSYGPAAPPPETDRWTNSSSKPDGDRWRSDGRRPAFGSGGGSRSSSTWSSSRNQRDR